MKCVCSGGDPFSGTPGSWDCSDTACPADDHGIGILLRNGANVTSNATVSENMFVSEEEGINVPLDKLEPVNMFSPDTFNVSEDGSYVTEISTGNRIELTTFMGMDESGTTVLANKGKDGMPLDVQISLPDGTAKSYIHVNESYVGYNSSDVDMEAMTELISSGEDAIPAPPDNSTNGTDVDGEVRRSLRGQQTQRGLQQRNCYNYYRLIDVAVAYDTDFCWALGGPANANARVQTIVARASQFYEKYLCIKLRISATDYQCWGSPWDPYMSLPNRDKSGCKGWGYLHDFGSKSWVLNSSFC